MTDESRMHDVLMIGRDAIMKVNPDITAVEFVNTSFSRPNDDDVIWTVERKGRSVIVFEKDGYAKVFPL